MPEYLISQHDPRGERSEQLAALRAAHSYDSAYGFPVAAGPPDGNGPSAQWQLRASPEQERIWLNLLTLRRRGKWDFVNELQPLAPRRLATMVHDQDVGGLLDYFLPSPGPEKHSHRSDTLRDYLEIFATIKPPEAVDRSETDEYFAEMRRGRPDQPRLS